MILQKKPVKLSRDEACQILEHIKNGWSLRYAVKLVTERANDRYIKKIELEHPDIYEEIKRIRMELKPAPKRGF